MSFLACSCYKILNSVLLLLLLFYMGVLSSQLWWLHNGKQNLPPFFLSPYTVSPPTTSPFLQCFLTIYLGCCLGWCYCCKLCYYSSSMVIKIFRTYKSFGFIFGMLCFTKGSYTSFWFSKLFQNVEKYRKLHLKFI